MYDRHLGRRTWTLRQRAIFWLLDHPRLWPPLPPEMAHRAFIWLFRFAGGKK